MKNPTACAPFAHHRLAYALPVLEVGSEEEAVSLAFRVDRGNLDLSHRHMRVKIRTGGPSLFRLLRSSNSLTRLTVDGCMLESLRDLGTSMEHLQELNARGCGLQTLDGSFGLPSLLSLDLSGNLIDDAGPCAALSNLIFLNLSSNLLENLEAMAFLNACDQLQELKIGGNPICNEPGIKEALEKILPGVIIDLESVYTEEEQPKKSEEKEESRSTTNLSSRPLSALLREKAQDFEDVKEPPPAVMAEKPSTQASPVTPLMMSGSFAAAVALSRRRDGAKSATPETQP